MSFQIHAWQRDPRNPIFPPREDFDIAACMNPFVLRRADEYWMFYAGGGRDGHRRICLAICRIGDVTSWKRLGPLFDVGTPGAFDDDWCVLPCVHNINGRWHLYYSGKSTIGAGLQSFPGMGLAISDDLLHWKKYSDTPIMTGSGWERWPDNIAIAGGGRIHELLQRNGKTLFRMFYTLPTGTSSPDLQVDQEKHAVCADSFDGIAWFNRQILLSPRVEADYENAAVIALNLWRESDEYRAVYAGIGSRFGAYSICEASSQDGLVWERGEPDENLALEPSGRDGNGAWADEMCEYPNLVEEKDGLRLFYCGNGYGATGIGTAVASRLS